MLTADDKFCHRDSGGGTEWAQRLEYQWLEDVIAGKIGVYLASFFIIMLLLLLLLLLLLHHFVVVVVVGDV